MRAAPALAIVGFAWACGPKAPPASWQEHELGAKHATPVDEAGGPVGEPGALPDDLTTLDTAAIDALDEVTVHAALARAQDDAPAARLALRAARLAYHRGDAAAARAIVARAATAADAKSVATELAALSSQLAEPPVDSKVIAVLLPLSGRFAAIGSELRAAIQLVPGVTWLVLDTRGEIEGATAAVADAVAKGALAILGPVGERESIAAARAAAVHGIPIALLAPADGADAASGVFRMVDSPADEGRSVAQLAADDNFPTVGVFAPRDDIGRDAAEAFVAEAERLGIAVTGQGTYDPTGGNLEPDVKEFLNLVPARNPRLAEHLRTHGRKAGWITFSPDIPFSLLYVPDKYDRAALVAAFLPYYNVELRSSEYVDPVLLERKHGGNIPQLVQLVGGAGWNHSTLPLRGGSAVQGALVVDVFAAELGGDLGAQFAQAFQQRTSRVPSTAAAQAFDAATAVVKAQASLQSPTDPRAAMRAALASVALPDGACGPAQMGSDGELHRDPLVLEVVGDVLEVMR